MIPRKGRRGHGLIVLLVLMGILMASGMALMNSVDMNVRLSRLEVTRFRAELAAESALNRLIVTNEGLAAADSRIYEFGPGESASSTVRPLAEGHWEVSTTGVVDRPQGTQRASLKAEVARDPGGKLRIVSFRRS